MDDRGREATLGPLIHFGFCPGAPGLDFRLGSGGRAG